MTKPEAMAFINKIEYKYLSFGLLHSDTYLYKPESLPILRECQKEIPEMHIYELENKFRLITKIEPMRYLITTNEFPPALTNWFDPENHFNEEIGMIVYDLVRHIYTTDGTTWNDIELDHL